MTEKGLFCPVGDFYIDPTRAVETAIITHAHSDHARKGSKTYYCTTQTLGLLKSRLGSNISTITKPYNEMFTIKGVTISFHPAGHILGSAQIRLEYAGEIWVVSGDYKREIDDTCLPFEPIPCDVFITEATFGTPAFIWDKTDNMGLDIYNWWMQNAKAGKHSVLFAYSLGKTQRILNLLAPYVEKPIFCDAATMELNGHYLTHNVQLAPTKIINDQNMQELVGELFVVPPSFFKTDYKLRLGRKFSTAFASGWTATRQRWHDKSFLLSDHADWNDLIKSIQETGAKRVYVQHRGKGALIRKLRSMGLQAYSDHALIPTNPTQLILF